jgi:hypothetical protein
MHLTKSILPLFILAVLGSQWACKPDPIEEPADGAIAISNKVYSETPQTWTNHNKNGVDYIITGRILFQLNATLTIEPGTEIVFENNGSLEMNATVLHATGTAADPIVFRGKDNSKGYWKGIVLYGKTDNQLNYCTIQDAGAGTGTGIGAVVVGNALGDAGLSITNTRIGNSASVGLDVYDESTLSAFSSNTITTCDYVASVTANSLGQLAGTANVLTGNTHDQVKVKGDQVRKSGLWPALPVAFLFSGETQIENEVTIEAGATLLFGADAELILYQNNSTSGKLFANGTPVKPILFKGANTTAGYWKGIKVNAGLANLTYCNISDGGKTGSSPHTGNLYITKTLGNVNVTIQHCTVGNSSNHGICIRTNTLAAVVQGDNLFSGISGENVHSW